MLFIHNPSGLRASLSAALTDEAVPIRSMHWYISAILSGPKARSRSSNLEILAGRTRSAGLGRVAGLLKLWLSQKSGQGASSVEVERMMVEFRELQAGIREKMSAVVFAKKHQG